MRRDSATALSVYPQGSLSLVHMPSLQQVAERHFGLSAFYDGSVLMVCSPDPQRVEDFSKYIVKFLPNDANGYANENLQDAKLGCEGTDANLVLTDLTR